MEFIFDENDLKFSFLSHISDLVVVKKEDKIYIQTNITYNDGEILFRVFFHNGYRLLSTSADVFNKNEFNLFIKEIIKKAPFVYKYEIIVDKLNFGTVDEYFSNKQTKFHVLTHLYHGTSSYYANIIMQEGLKPRKMTNVSASFFNTKDEGNSSYIYLSTSPRFELRRAGSAAAQKSQGHNNLLKINIEGIDKNKLVPCDKVWKEGMTIDDCLMISSTLLYPETIEPKYITNEGVIPYSMIFTEAVKYYASQENKDANTAKTDPSTQGK